MNELKYAGMTGRYSTWIVNASRKRGNVDRQRDMYYVQRHLCECLFAGLD